MSNGRLRRSLGDYRQKDTHMTSDERQKLGKEHPNTLTSMKDLASTYWSQGKLQEASDLQERVLKMMSKILGEEHPDTLRSMSNLSLTYESEGRVKEAANLMKKAFEGSQRTLGDEHPDTIGREFTLGQLNDSLHRAENAT